MLSSEHAIVTYHRGRAIPDRLTRVKHAHYVGYARRMLAVYRNGVGRTRRELHRAIRDIFAAEPDCDLRRIGAFCRLLDDAGEFTADKRGEAAELRLRVFSEAAAFHPLVAEPDQLYERSEREVKTTIAAKIGRPWDEIEAALYGDVIDLQRLASFGGYADEAALLSRYNVAQLQACLYKASRMTVRTRADFASIVRYAKLARLLLEVRRGRGDEYVIELSGPASVLRETRRYGVNFARFVPALLACGDWSFEATVRTPWGSMARLGLSNEDGYSSHLPAPAEFDSSVEEHFARKWGEQREGWRLLRDAGILQSGQTSFVPDFLLRHDDGREVFLEIVGFWTPEYLAAKRKTLALFRERRIVIAVPEQSLKANASVGPEVIVYKTAIKIDTVLTALRELRWGGCAME